MNTAHRLRLVLGRARSSGASLVWHGADRATRTILATGNGRSNALVPKAVAFMVARAPDQGVVADDAILRLKEYVELDATQLVANYLLGLLPAGRYHDDGSYYWEAIERRALITADNARLPKEIRRQARNSDLEIRLNDRPAEVIQGCRRGAGTWLNSALLAVLLEAVELGTCTTIGAFRGDELVAGEFGLDLGGWYAGMSAFHTEPNAGNVVRAYVVSQVMESGRFVVLDAGEAKPHTMRFGAEIVDEDDFGRQLQRHLGRCVQGPAS